MAADTKLFEFMFALDEYQVLLMKDKYSFKELAAARAELISRFKARGMEPEKALEKKPEVKASISALKPVFKSIKTPLEKALEEKTDWNTAWHIARSNGGKMYWRGYREGVKAQQKISHPDDPQVSVPYLDLNGKIPVRGE